MEGVNTVGNAKLKFLKPLYFLVFLNLNRDARFFWKLFMKHIE